MISFEVELVKNNKNKTTKDRDTNGFLTKATIDFLEGVRIRRLCGFDSEVLFLLNPTVELYIILNVPSSYKL